MYRQKKLGTILCKKLGQLNQGIRTVKGTNTFIFIPKTQVPKYKKIAYGRIVRKLKPEKEEKE